MHVRPNEHLGHDELVQLARERAEAGDPRPVHSFPIGSHQAVSYELAFEQRRRELETDEAF